MLVLNVRKLFIKATKRALWSWIEDDSRVFNKGY
jgi:hypothetical protein